MFFVCLFVVFFINDKAAVMSKFYTCKFSLSLHGNNGVEKSIMFLFIYNIYFIFIFFYFFIFYFFVVVFENHYNISSIIR